MAPSDFAPLIRIALRYLAAFLVTKGFISPDFGTALMDPATLAAVTGVIVSLGTEAWYRVAKKKGGAT